MNKFNELENIFDLKGGYKSYRHALQNVDPPAIPFLGVFTKDVYLIRQHNDTYKEDGSINFEKFSLLVKIIRDLLHFQTISYRYESDPILQQYLKKLQVIRICFVLLLSYFCIYSFYKF